MRIRATIFLISFFLTSYGQYNDFKTYLSKNKETIALNGKYEWNILMKDALKSRLIILGESHGAQVTQLIDFRLLQFLNKRCNVSNYIAEMDFAQAALINEYLNEGDETKLKSVFRYWVSNHMQWGNYDFYKKIINIRNLNKSLSVGKKIKFIGIDAVQDYNGYIQFIKKLISNKESEILDSLKIAINLFEKDSNKQIISSFAQRYVHLISKNEPELQKIIKENFLIFKYLIQNLSHSGGSSGIDRPESIYRNFKYLFNALKLENKQLYGMWGLFHSFLTPFEYFGDDFISKLANSNHPISSKITSIVCLPIDSKLNMWDDKTKSWVKLNFSYDDKSLLEIEGIQDVKELTKENSTTLFKLNGLNSPFPKTGRLVNGKAPQGKLIVDYKNQNYASQYIILFRNSDWLRPIPENF